MEVKFGVHIEPQLGYDYETVERIALEAERVGFNWLLQIVRYDLSKWLIRI
jgi:hypothetical protein